MLLFSFFINFIILSPLICIFLINFINIYSHILVKYFVSIFIFIELLLIIFCIIFFMDNVIFNYIYILNFFFFSFDIVLGIDYISLYFILLTLFINCICFLFNWLNYLFNSTLFFYNLLLLQIFILICVFLVLDIFIFYIFFEFILLVIFILMLFFGSRSRKIRASFLLFIYTIFGSILLLFCIIYIWLLLGSTSYFYLLIIDFDFDLQVFMWFSFFLSFAVKVPMIPFHVWLPEAHVEAPTVGSVLLAGILLKLGTYGFFRFSLVLFPQVSYYFLPLIYTLSILGVLYSSFNAICQTDIKRIIAYSSIAHMNLIMLGLFSFDLIGLTGCFLQMLNHGIVSGGLFIAIGILYDFFHTRLLKYYGGLFQIMPIFSFFFLILIFANIALPGTCSFVGEFLIFLSFFNNSFVVIFFGIFCMVCGGIYSLWLFNKICFGNINIKYNFIFSDINFFLIFIFFLLCFYIFIIGFFAFFFLNIFVYNFGFYLTIILLNV